MRPLPAGHSITSPRGWRLAGAACFAMAAAPAWAGLPEVFMSPFVPVGAGLATLCGLAGGSYILMLRQRLAAQPAADAASPSHDRRFRLAA